VCLGHALKYTMKRQPHVLSSTFKHDLKYYKVDLSEISSLYHFVVVHGLSFFYIVAPLDMYLIQNSVIVVS